MEEAAFFMQLALTEAWNYQHLTYPNPAVGCAITDANGALLCVGAHQKAGLAHAEVLALQQAAVKLGLSPSLLSLTHSADIHDYLLTHAREIFKECTLYVTLEPCSHEGKTPACAHLLAALRPKKVVIGLLDPTQAGGGALMLEQAGIEVVYDVLQEACADLLEPFLAWQKGGFRVFKYAMRLNGTMDAGTISSHASRVHVHKIRNVADALLIGGGTVRADNPLLDSRLIAGRAPNVRILTRQGIDDDARLYGIPHRSVTCVSEIDALFKSGLEFIEGGTSMLEATYEALDWMMVYVAFSMQKGATMQTSFNGRVLHAMPVGEDYLFWIKKEPRE